MRKLLSELTTNMHAFLDTFRVFLLTQQLSLSSMHQILSDMEDFATWIAREGNTHESGDDQDLIVTYLLTCSDTQQEAIKESFSYLQDFLNTSYLQSLTPISAPEKQASLNQAIVDLYAQDLEKTKKHATVKNYKSDIGAFLAAIPHQALCEALTPEHLRQYQAYLESQAVAIATIRRKTSVIHHFAAWATTQHFLKQNPFQKPPLLSIPFEILPGLRKPSTTSPASPSRHRFPDLFGSRGAAFKQAYDRYHSWPVSSYLHLAVLVCVSIFISLLGFEQFYRSTSRSLAYPTTLTAPSRILSFQARLTDASQTPITTSTNLVFKLFTASSGGTELWSSGTCAITPDQNGIFSTLLGSTCGSAIGSGVFSENTEVWLEVTVGAETLTPRQRIASVAYALNSETLQGYPPADPATINTIPVVNNLGQIIIAASSPTLQSTTGTFGIKADALSITTDTGTSGTITIAPDGTGQVSFIGGTTTQDFIDISNANLTTGTLVKGTVGNNNTGYKFLSFLGGSSPTEKFSVDARGNVTQTGYLTAPGATLSATYTGANPLVINGTGGQIFAIANNGNMTAAGTLTGLTGLSSSGTITFSGLSANRFVKTTTGGELTTSQYVDLTTEVTGVLPLANGGTNKNMTAANGAIAYSDADSLELSAVGSAGECLKSGGAGAPTWGACSSGGSSNWRFNAGTISPINDTVDLLVGANATSSAKFAVLNVNSGTPTASVSAGATGATYMSASGTIATTARQGLTLGDPATTGRISAFSTGLLTLDSSDDITLDADGADIFLADNGSTFATLTNSTTDLTIDIAGGQLLLADTDVINIGGVSALAYNALANSGGSAGAASVDADNDLYIQGDLEVDAITTLDGTLDSNGDVTIADTNIIFDGASTTFTTSGALTIGSNAQTIAIDSNDWDITTAGNMSGIGTISSNGDWTNSQATPTINLTDSTAASDDYTVNVEANAFDITNSTDSRIELQFVGDGSINLGDNTATKTIEIGGVTASAADTIRIATEATSADTITIGNTNAATTLTLSANATTVNGSVTLAALTANRFVKTTTGGLLTTSQFVDLTTEITGVLPLANGGTNKNMTAVNGGIVYTDADSMEVSAAGNSGECLKSGGAGAPTWGSCTTGVVNSNWRENQGTLSPLNDTWDLLVGANATTSAKFAILNNNLARGNQVASVAGSLSLDAAGSIQTTRNQALTIGGSSTGTISLVPNNTTVLSISAPGTTNTGTFTSSGGAINLNASSNFVTNIGTGTTTSTVSIGGGSNLIALDSSVWDISGAGAASGFTGITSSGTITFSGLTANRFVKTTTGGELTTSQYVDLTTEITGVLPLANGGSNKNLTAVNGGIVYSDADSFEILAAGNLGDCLKSGGAGAPTWDSCSTGASSNWRFNLGTLSPINDTVDVLLGANATTSAKFAFLNMNLARGNQVASVAGSLTLDAAGSLQTTRNQLLTLGGSTTGTIGLMPNNGNGSVGIGTTAPSGKLEIQGDNNALASLNTSSNYLLNLRNAQNDTGEAVGISFGLSTGGDIGASIYHTREGSNSYGYLSFATKANGGNVTERMRITNEGNVGIGTLPPTAKFHVDGGYGANALAIFNELNGQDIIAASASGTTRMRLDTNGYLYAQRFVDIANSNYFLDPAATTTSMTVAGGVGVGTTSLLATVDIRGQSGTIPAASISAQTASSVLTIDNAGVGDLFTASVSGGIRAVLEGDGDYKIAGIYSALSSYVTKIGASGNTAGTTANNNILFVDSTGTTQGRFETVTSQTYSTAAGDGSDGDIIITGTKNLNTDTIASGRSYADGIAYKIDPATATDSGTTVKLYDAPNGIAAGDEVLIINMQGASGDTTDVGNYEFKKISSINVSTREVTFSSAITKSYNGTTPSNQKIVIQRIPQYETIFVDGTLTASGWEGLTTIPTGTAGYYTGIVAFRASKNAYVSGSVSAAGIGYRGGAAGTGTTTDSGGGGGESYDGTLTQSGADTNSDNQASGGGERSSGSTASPNNGAARGGGGGGAGDDLDGGGAGGGGYGGGGGGGGGAGTGSGGSGGAGGTTGVNAGGGGGSTTGSTGANGGAAGSAGSNGIGTGGEAGSGATGGSGGGGSNDGVSGTGAGGGGGGLYGDTALSDMFLGSGGAGGGSGGAADPGGAGGDGGGIVFIGATQLSVTGSIASSGDTGSSAGDDGGAGGGGSGGSVYIAATTVNLQGGPSTSGGAGGTADDGGDGGSGGIGRMRVEATTLTNVSADASTSTTISAGAESATDEPTTESSGNLYVAGFYSALSGSNTSIRASGSTSGRNNDGSIYFLDSNSITRGRVDTALQASPYGDGADGAITVSGTFNINTTNLASGRTYADGIAYRVNAPSIGDTSVSRYSGSDTISNGIAAGDEVMLINLQGTSGDFADVGNYEFFRVTAATASTITFDRPIARPYAGESAANQKVVIQRIPNYTTITMTAAITAANWDGLTTTPTGAAGYYTGIVAFRAQSLVNSSGNTAVWADGLGYRGGAGGNSTVAYGGESYDGSIYGYGGLSQSNGPSGGGGVEGDGSAGTDSQGIRGGGGGGGSTGSTSATNNGGGGGAGGGYGGGGGGGGGGGDGAGAGGAGGLGGDTGIGGGGGGGNRNGTAAGGAGGNAGSAGSTASGAGGAAGTGSYTGWGGNGSGAGVASTISGSGGGGGGLYGDPDLSKMFHGSGGGGGGWAQAGGGAGGAGGDGGGIVFVAAKTIYWNSTDSIRSVGLAGSAAATNGGMGGGGSGGSVYLIVEKNTLNPGYIAYAPGGAGAAVSGETGGGGNGGVGRVKIEGGMLNASTTPLASYQRTYSPWALSPQSNSASTAYGTLHIGSVNTTDADLAEYYVTGDRDVEAGDVVMFSNTTLLGDNGEEVTNKGVLRKADQPYHKRLAGIISTAPGLVLGSVDGETGKADKRQLALSGRVPVKIDPDSEAIGIGDFLTSSDKPGYAKKATQAGYTVGKALETWTPGSGGTIEAFVTLGYYDPDRDLDQVENLMGLFDLMEASSSATASDSATATSSGTLSSRFSLFKSSGEMIQKVITASEGFIANLRVGGLTAKKIQTEQLFIGDKTVSEYITDTLSQEVIDNLSTSLATASALQSENLMVKLNTATESGIADTFAVTTKDDLAVFAVNELGDATVSGSLTAPEIVTENLLVRDATISGTLYADKIVGLEKYLRQMESTPSAPPTSELVEELPVETQILLEQMQTDMQTWKDHLASRSSVIDTNAVFIDEFLGVSGLASFAQASVAGQLTIGNSLQLSANTLSLANPLDTFFIKPDGMGSFDLLAGALTLSQTGGLVVNTDALFAGNVTIQEDLMVSNIYSPQGDLTFKLASGSADSKIAVKNAQDELVASISASGAATFQKLIIASENQGSPETLTTTAAPNASTGTGVLPAGSTTITITTTSVTPDSLVYVTPTSSTSNQVLYVQSKVAEDPATTGNEGAFTVSLDTPLPQDVSFNWWVIN